MAPVSGLIAHAITRHEPRPEMQLARVTYEILGMIPALPTTVEVRTVRPGRTIELVEAVASVADRPVIRASAWRLSRQDTSEVAGGLPERLGGPEGWQTWQPSQMWAGGYIRAIEF
ncbi:MAG: thioesterase family protein, partial [Dermatophilaceae bacterium]|nr:thioesterase family protein [Dermatophilaceae bacterium]